MASKKTAKKRRAGKRAEKKRAERKQKQKRTPPAKTRTGTPDPAHTITLRYPDAGGLVQAGPFVRGRWSVPGALAEAMRQKGHAVSAPIDGWLLVDTGAKSTCIALDAATELGLKPTTLVQVAGAAGISNQPLFLAALQVDLGDDGVGVSTTRPVVGIPALNEPSEAIGLQIAGAPARVVGILGRDFLALGTMIYDGQKGEVEIRIPNLPVR